MFSSMLGFASQVFSLLALNQAKGSTYPPKCSLLMVGGKRKWWSERKRSHFLSFPPHSVMFYSISQCMGLSKISPFVVVVGTLNFCLLLIWPPKLFVFLPLYSLATSCRILPKEQCFSQSPWHLMHGLVQNGSATTCWNPCSDGWSLW